jgi:hypothetical protein
MNEDAAKASGMAYLQKILADFEKQYPVAAPSGGLKVGSKEELTNVLIWLAQHMFSELVSVTILVSFMFEQAARNWLTRVTSTDQPNKSSRSRDISLGRRRRRSFQRGLQEISDDKQLHQNGG